MSNISPTLQAWRKFCQTLSNAGEHIIGENVPSDELTQSEGFRYLSRLTRIGLEMFVEGADRDFPTFYAPSHETAKIGADNPDNVYLRAEINGVNDYRIWGNRGTVHYLGFGTQAGGYGEDGKNEPTGYIDSHQLTVDEQGNFEVILSANPQKGNWLAMKDSTNTVIVRQTFLDREQEQKSQIYIERINHNATQQPKALKAEGFTQSLLSAAQFVDGTAGLFAQWTQSYQQHINQLPPANQALCQAVGGDPNIFYYHSYWQLADDEVLVIDVASIPNCDTWNFQLNNYWMESLDYRYFTIHVNKHTAVYQADGSIRIIVSHQNPGLPNWIQTAGHQQGTMCFRWIGAQSQVHPTTQVMTLKELKKLL